jgi:hypothetical protein
VIRYGSGVWSDHRRGMFRGATERQGAITTGTGYGGRAADPEGSPAPHSDHSIHRQYQTAHMPPAPRERCSAEP